MHSNSCVSSNLSDVFPSIPLQDATPNGTVGGQLVNIGGLNPNHAADVNSSLKYLGLNLQSQIGNNLTNSNGFFNEDRSRTNLIINYLPQSYDQNDLQRLFERVGPIRQCKLIRDKNTGASLCYGFVDFISPQHAALAIQTYHGYETEQKRLRVAYASSGGRRFTAAHRIPPFGPNVVGGNTEVTNENIIGWEVFAIGIPLEWSEPDLLKLFSNFGNVILIRLLAPQLSESPPSHKPRLSSPVLNGASSDLSTESTDSGRLTTTASIIFEEKGSAEISVFRLNGYQAPDWTTPLRLRIIGSVTRETYGMFCLPSRQSPALISSRIPNGLNSGDPLTESEVLNNLLNRRTLASSNSSVHGRMPISVDVMSNLGTFMKAVDSGCGMGPLDVHPSSFGVPPRAIIRNKVNDSANPLLAHSGLSHGQTLELLDLMDSQSNVATTNASGMMNSADRFSGRELSIVNALSAHRSLEQENSKIDTALRNLTTQNSPWSFGQQRSVLSTLPEAVRGNDVLLTSNVKRLSIRSPLILSPMLSNAASQRGCQAQVWLKLENIQPTGSFKIRGIENVCRKWASSGVTHIFCPSGGNAAIAAAYAARAYGLNCTIIMPETSEPNIRRRILLEAPDTKVVLHGSDWLESNHRAEQLVNDFHSNHPGESGARLLHPYDQPELWEGYESIIEELTPEIGQPDVVVVSVGGGGLLAGVIQGLWNRGWSSTHVVAVETEDADCLNRSLKAGQLLVVPRSTGIASSLMAPVLAHRTWNLAQLQSLSPVVCSDADVVDAMKRFLDDHGFLVEPACGASLSAIYSGAIGRLQLEGRIPRPANVLVIVSGGRNVSLRQLCEWENQVNNFGADHIAASFMPPIANPYLSRSSPRTVLCSDINAKPTNFGQHAASDSDDTLKMGSSAPNTPRAVCTILSRTPATSDAPETNTTNSADRDVNVDGGGGGLNPHDLVNFSKLLAPSENDADDVPLHD